MVIKNKKILFAISSLGLGHATRSIVLIKQKIKQGYNIDIISYGNALKYLRKELSGFSINFMELKDYPSLERGTGIMFYFYLSFDLFITVKTIKKERDFIKKIENNYIEIYSDGRYGIYSKKIPSYLITHQLSFMSPKGFELFQKFSDLGNIEHFKKFTKILIPDFKDKTKSLAGKLSHPNRINKINHKYIGILSDFDKNYKVDNQKKIDYLFTITGYLQEHKKTFIDELIKQSRCLKGKKIFVLGDTKNKYKKEIGDNITIFSYVDKQEKKELFENADIIISRSGYTTIMDLIRLNKKAILFPTLHQTEQEYLAKYLSNRPEFIIGEDPKNLVNLIKKI